MNQKRYVLAKLALCAYLLMALPAGKLVVPPSPPEPSEQAECLRDRAYEWFASSKGTETAELAVLAAAMACQAMPVDAYAAFVLVADELRAVNDPAGKQL